jgi:uncharacterized protein YjbI with pentapeptide repeats
MRFGRTACVCVFAALCGALGLLAESSAARNSDPLVRVEDAKLVKSGGEAIVTARILWNREGIADPDEPMIVGDVRLLAVVGSDARARLLASSTSQTLERQPVQEVRFVLRKPGALDAIRKGNGVVLTATQHGPAGVGETTTKSFVTVAQLQVGQPRRVGLRDCSEEPVVPHAHLTECDLVGASLAHAQVGNGNVRTELLKADLTGADLRYADLSHVDLAGGRVNGADATHANIVQMSLSNGEGIGFIAQAGTTFDFSNFFDARLDDANFSDVEFPDFPKQVSFGSAKLNGADFRGATLKGTFMELAQLRRANLRGANLVGAGLNFADFGHARLRGATVDEPALMWVLMCHTELPGGGFENRDCTRTSGHHRPPLATPFVTVDAALRRPSGRAVITGTVHWNEAGARVNRMVVGEIRAVAVDSDTGMPTILARKTVTISANQTHTPFSFEVAPKRLSSLPRGNRVVVTATQHPEGETTYRSYVTVKQLQKGPIPGRVGSVECSDQALVPGSTALQFCDLVGAALAHAELKGGDLRMDDLTGADLRAAGLSGAMIDGARLAGVPASGARLDSAELIALYAPRLQVRSTSIVGARFDGSTLDAASFAGSAMRDTRFTAANARGASFADTQLDNGDLAYIDLTGGDLSRARAENEDQPTSLFLAELRNADLRGSFWVLDKPERRYPPTSGWLCHTTMPDGSVDDRDCPRR